MKKISPSTWVLIGLVVVIAGLGTSLILLAPAGLHDGWAFGHMGSRGQGPFLRNAPSEEGQSEGETPSEWGWGRGFGRHHRDFGGMRPGHPGMRFPIVGVLLLGGGVALIVYLAGRRKSSGGSRRRSAQDILEEQYAEGKIDEQEFRRRRAVLGEEDEGV